jgi:hypothetical protein
MSASALRGLWDGHLQRRQPEAKNRPIDQSGTPAVASLGLLFLARDDSRELRLGGDLASSASRCRLHRDANRAQSFVPVGEVMLTHDQASLDPEDLPEA